MLRGCGVRWIYATVSHYLSLIHSLLSTASSVSKSPEFLPQPNLNNIPAKPIKTGNQVTTVFFFLVSSRRYNFGLPWKFSSNFVYYF